MSFELAAAPVMFWANRARALATAPDWRLWLDVEVVGTADDAMGVLQKIIGTVERPRTPPPGRIVGPFEGHWYHHDAGLDISPDGSAVLKLRGSCCYPEWTLNFRTTRAPDGSSLMATVTSMSYVDENERPAPVPPTEEGQATDSVGDEYVFTFAAPQLLRITRTRAASGEIETKPNEYYCGDVAVRLSYNCGA